MVMISVECSMFSIFGLVLRNGLTYFKSTKNYVSAVVDFTA